MGTFDTIGGTPRHDPAFDGGDPPAHEEDFLELLERSATLRRDAAVATKALTATLADALAVLLPAGTIVHKGYSRDRPRWAQNIQHVTGTDRGAQRFEIAGRLSVEFNESHPDLSWWYADAYPINEAGKRLSGRPGNSRFGGGSPTLRIRAHVFSTAGSESAEDVHMLLVQVIAAAHEKRVATGAAA